MTAVLTYLACWFRHHLWRLVCALSGGLTVTGCRGPGTRGCIVVANHSSHADTAVLLAALPPSARPVFAAASDYWFEVPVRHLLVTSLAGALPIRRTQNSAYQALLAAVRPALEHGRTVVVYPEGTRTRDGTIGEFRSGAIHLARDCGVPLLPVALLGTREVLPKNGGFTPAPMEVRFGCLLDPDHVTADELRATVARLRDGQGVLGRPA